MILESKIATLFRTYVSYVITIRFTNEGWELAEKTISSENIATAKNKAASTKIIAFSGFLPNCI
jgi:hypothetical protein